MNFIYNSLWKLQYYTADFDRGCPFTRKFSISAGKVQISLSATISGFTNVRQLQNKNMNRNLLGVRQVNADAGGNMHMSKLLYNNLGSKADIFSTDQYIFFNHLGEYRILTKR